LTDRKHLEEWLALFKKIEGVHIPELPSAEEMMARKSSVATAVASSSSGARSSVAAALSQYSEGGLTGINIHILRILMQYV